MKNKNIDLKRIFGFIKPQWPFFTLSIISGLFYVIFNSISIWLTASLVNNVLMDFNQLLLDQESLIKKEILSINDKLKIIANSFIVRETNIGTLKILCLSIVSIFILKNIFLYLKNLSMSFVQLRVVTNLRNQVYSHLQKMSLSFFYKRQYGDLSSVIIHDVGTLNISIGTVFQKIIVEPINIFVFALLLFIISWELTLIAILVIPLSQFVIQLIGTSIRRKARRNTKQIGGITSLIIETLSSIRIVQAFGMEDKEIKRFNYESWKYFNLLFRSSKLRLMASPIIESIGVGMAVLLLWFGGSEVMVKSSLSSEDFLRFMFLLFSMLGPIRSLSNVNVILQNGYASAERIFDVLDKKPEVVDSGISKIYELKEGVLFKDVEFFYEDGRFNLSNINFKIPKGKTIALVGPSGSGKSTIADLIPRFFDVKKGKISIDGKDIKEYSIKSLRNLMGIVTQETLLLNSSVRSNIIYGNDSEDYSRLIEAAENANSIDFINNLENGFDTQIGDKGAKLSGGQRQRLAIARAIYNNPQLLILDEATSSLDTESEKKVQIALENLMKDRTVLVIAHRLSTIRNADSIVVMQDGNLVEEGDHNLLMKLNGIYSKLYRNIAQK